MSWLTSLLARLLPGLVVDATTRLVQAARESMRPKPVVPEPPPPIGESGAREASAYLDGAAGVTWKRHMDERAAGAGERLAQAAEDEPVEAEQPVEEEGNRS